MRGAVILKSPEQVMRERQQAILAAQPDAIHSELRAVPDRELVEALVSVGQPRWSAARDIRHPQGRFHALRLWCDLQDASEGNKAAQERIDFIRAQFSVERAIENISDDPRRGYGHIHDPRELL